MVKTPSEMMPWVKMPTEKLDEVITREKQMMTELNEIEETEDEILKSLSEIKRAMNISEQKMRPKMRSKSSKVSKATPIVEAAEADIIEEAAEAYVIKQAAEANDGTMTTNVFDTLANEVGAVKTKVESMDDKMKTLEAMMAQIIELVTPEEVTD